MNLSATQVNNIAREFLQTAGPQETVITKTVPVGDEWWVIVQVTTASGEELKLLKVDDKTEKAASYF